jgi:hypothetical protein
MRRIVFNPRPSGFRFYHTHNRAGADLHAGQYSGQVGPVYIWCTEGGETWKYCCISDSAGGHPWILP